MSKRWEAYCDRGSQAFQSGRLDLAEQYYWGAVEESKQFGEADARLATSLNNLAVVLRTRGDFQKVEDLYNLTIRIWKTIDENHVCTAMALNNAASFHQAVGHYNQARALYKKALKIFESRPDPEDYLLAACLSNLGRLHCLQERHAQAESCYKRALAIAERLLGNDHHCVALVLSGMGALYTRLEKYSRAESALLRALEVLQRTQGPDHPDVATCLVHLADLYRSQAQAAADMAFEPSEKKQSIEPLYTEALTIRERNLGKVHPDIAAIHRSLGSLNASLNQLDKAEHSYRKALKMYLEVFGPYHGEVIACLEESAHLMRKRGRYEEAARLEERAGLLRQKASEKPQGLPEVYDELAADP